MTPSVSVRVDGQIMIFDTFLVGVRPEALIRVSDIGLKPIGWFAREYFA